MSDYTCTTPEGHDMQIRAEGAVMADFEYDDGSTLTIEQDADGNRVFRVDHSGT
ncbi:hypothetical protein ACFWPK_04430 [Nocardia sp. NPDC058519]|uniref:hypothetical protein n=1 Tax=Nocardia sp. NPDC058519 TaxID=3346535 RepID=UPI00364A8C42